MDSNRFRLSLCFAAGLASTLALSVSAGPADHWTDSETNWFRDGARIQRPNGGSLADSRVLIQDQLLVEYRAYRVPWIGQTSTALGTCEGRAGALGEADSNRHVGEIPQLWRLEVRLANQSNESIHFLHFPPVELVFDTGTTMGSLCRTWGGSPREPSLNGSWISAGSVVQQLSPRTLLPGDSGVSVHYGVTLPDLPYELTEWRIGRYLSRPVRGPGGVWPGAEVILSDALRERFRLDDAERARKLAMLRDEERRQAESEEQARQLAIERRAARHRTEQSQGNLLSTLVRGMGVVSGGLAPGGDPQSAGAALAGLMHEALGGEPIDVSPYLPGAAGALEVVGAAQSDGTVSGDVSAALAKVEEKCGERYAGPSLHGQSMQITTLCGAAYAYHCEIKRGVAAQHAKARSCGMYEELRKSNWPQGPSCPYCP